MKILGISRSPRFSPNSVERDGAIFQAVADALRRAGHDVTTTCEDRFTTTGAADVVYNMGRDVPFLEALRREARVPVVNHPEALLRATRSALTRLFEQQGVPIPRSLTFATAAPEGAAIEAFGATCTGGLWMKRGDACAQSATDVRFLATAAEVGPALADFARRGIAEGVLCEHVPGDLVKFYGVEGTAFFHLYYPTEGKNFSKFGLEKINGAPTGYAFSQAALKACADRAARLSGFIVYGGDAIVRRDGSFQLIDFNDWPSFSRCSAEAAHAIAARVASLCPVGSSVKVRSALQSL